MLKHRWIFLLLLLIAGCGKDPDSSPEPVIELTSPFENQVYNTFDTIFIKARVEHISRISSITLSITDTDLKPIVSGKVIEPGSSNYNIDTYLVADNRYITAAKNYLQIRIEVGQAIYRYWYTININPLTRELQDVLVIAGDHNSNKLYKLKPPEAELIWSWTSEYIGGYADSRNTMFYSSGSIISGITAYDLAEKSVAWSIPTISNGSIPYYTSFTARDGSIATGISEGSIVSYNSQGLKILSTPVQHGGVYTRVMHFNDRIVAVFSPYSTNQNTFMVFNNPAGNLFASINFTGQIVDILKISTNRIFLIINQQGINKAFEYNVITNGLVFMHNVTSETINMISGNGTDYFIGTSTSIFWYKPLSGSVFRYLTASDVTALALDDTTFILYAAEGVKLNSYKLPYSTPVLSHNFNEPVKDIQLIYNK